MDELKDNIPDGFVPKEEYDKLKSDTTKGAQKLISEKKELEEKARQSDILQEVLDKIEIVADNPQELINIYEDNEEVAQRILDKYYGGISIDEFKQKLNPTKEIDIKKIEEEVERNILKKQEEKEIQNIIKDFIKENLDDEESIEKFKEEYESITEGKKLNKNNVNKFLNISLKEVGVSIKEVVSKQTVGTQQDTQKQGEFKKAVDDFKKFKDKYF